MATTSPGISYRQRSILLGNHRMCFVQNQNCCLEKLWVFGQFPFIYIFDTKSAWILCGKSCTRKLNFVTIKHRLWLSYVASKCNIEHEKLLPPTFRQFYLFWRKTCSTYGTRGVTLTTNQGKGYTNHFTDTYTELMPRVITCSKDIIHVYNTYISSLVCSKTNDWKPNNWYGCKKIDKPD